MSVLPSVLAALLVSSLVPASALAQDAHEPQLDECIEAYGYSCVAAYAKYIYDKYGDMPWTEPEVTLTGIDAPGDFLDGIEAVSIVEVDGTDVLVVEVSEAAAKVSPEKVEVFDVGASVSIGNGPAVPSDTVSIGNGPVRLAETNVWMLALSQTVDLGDTLVVVFDGDAAKGLVLDIKDQRR